MALPSLDDSNGKISIYTNWKKNQQNEKIIGLIVIIYKIYYVTLYPVTS